MQAALERAFAHRLPTDAEPRVGPVTGTSATGMSSETLLFDLSWRDAGGARRDPLVARVAPDPADVPVFPQYDLEGQARTIALVGELTDVPVPRIWWSEPDAAEIGAPYFVMNRIEGKVPPDVPPYAFGDNWLYDASPDDQAQLQAGSVDILARLHAVTQPAERFAHLAPGGLDRNVERTRAWYEFAAADCGKSPLVEAALAWVEEHRPARPGPTVLCWGDARIGNVLYDGFRPAAVLDWEMAALGPAELDVMWMVYTHRMFEDLAAGYGLPAMPHFLRPADVVATYQRLTGRPLADVEWYGTYACLQLAIVFLRTGWRQVRFGERPPPQSVDELIINAAPLERMLAGTYWDRI